MNQLKKILEGAKRFSFWIICFGVCAVALATAILTARSMSEARKKLESEINSDVTKIENVRKTTAAGAETVNAHPNRYTEEGMKEQIKVAGAEALEAWKLRYDSQAPVFTWPEDLLGPATRAFTSQPIPERFLPSGKLVNPSDALLPSNASDDSADEEISTINTQELDKFAQVIHLRMPQLASIIGAKWAYEAIDDNAQNAASGDDATAGAGRFSRANVRSDGVKVEKQVVEWRSADQTRWNDMVTNFKGISRLPTNRPTLPMALYIQQDLWLLESLFKVIKQVNGDADAKDNADIKKIDHIFFGKNALGMSGSIDAPKGSWLKLAVDQGKKRDLPPATKAGVVPAAQKFLGQVNSRDFLNGRYVNSKFEPLTAATVRGAIAVDKLSNNAELIVAKRIPFRIAFEMDERKIPKFLAAFANSPFRFEVRQVRINRHIPGQTTTADGKEIGGEAVPLDALDGASGGSRGAANSDAPKEIATRTNYDVKVEFYGIVKVYNPVNLKLLQAPTETAPIQTATK